jgi:hypothetical protein
MSTCQTRQGWGITAVVVLALAALAPTLTRPVFANEPLNELSVELRLVETTPGKILTGASATGVARIEVLVESRQETNDLELAVLRPDGSVWTVKGRPFAIGRPDWSTAGGTRMEAGVHGVSVPARGGLHTTIAVPLEGAALHEIIVAVKGVSGGAPIASEAAVRAALGVPDHRPVDDGTYAHFPVKEVK